MPIFTQAMRRVSLYALAAASFLPTGGNAFGQLPVLGNPAEEWLDLVDYTKLEDILFGSAPTGAGVTIGQVEAASGPSFVNFYPDTSSAEFDAASDPSGTGVTFINGSQSARPNPTTSSHATTTVGRNLYGNTTGAAKESNVVVVYEANDYLNNQLRAPTGSDPRKPEYEDPAEGEFLPLKVINHSWAGDFGSNTNNRRTLVRLDYVIDRYDVTMAVGVSVNGDTDPATTTKPPHPEISPLLGQSYNAIAVGGPQGLHSIEPTESYYGGGRTKPDIVAGGFTVSSNTAMVSSVASVLHEVVAGTDAAKSETMKAILLAGATKEQYFETFVDPDSGLVDPWERTPSQPLDNIFGAGQLNAFNSYVMTEGGQFTGSTGAAGSPIANHGWDYQSEITPTDDVKYEFTIPEGKHAAEVSIVLAWNYEVTDINPGNAFSPSESFANLDLELLDSDGGLIDHSVSVVDNVEHVYVTGLSPGTYTFQVSTDAARDYGIAWRINTAFDQESADFDGDGDVDSADLLVWQRGYGTLVGAQHSDGDADGDGDVDEDDRVFLDSQFGLVLGTLDAIAATIPEPTGATLLGGVLFYLIGSRGRRR
ncbi:MAG: hypothetical protein AAGA92_06240 [Planctomycetota bacterium]